MATLQTYKIEIGVVRQVIYLQIKNYNRYIRKSRNVNNILLQTIHENRHVQIFSLLTIFIYIYIFLIELLNKIIEEQ